MNTQKPVTFELDPKWRGKIVYEVIDPKGNSIGDPFDTFTQMIVELMDSEIGLRLKGEFMTEVLDGRFSQEEMDAYVWDNFERVADEMGYKVNSKIVGEQ